MAKDDEENDESIPKNIIIRKAVDLQRIKLEKLMKNPEKPAFIPDSLKDKKFPDAPEFVRNVMGSSAGAGSGEFHVYRHVRRREYSRNLYLQKSKEKQLLDEEYHDKLEKNRETAENKTAKKRAKRQKFKMKKKLKSKQSKSEKHSSSDSDLTEESENEEEKLQTEKENAQQ